MTLDQAIRHVIKSGFKDPYFLRFDAFVSEDEEVDYRTPDLSFIEPISFDRKEEEELTFLFQFGAENGQRGFVVLDLQEHKDPISIEMIEALDIPNLSKP